jgi:predicted component of type VI protein secretion system
MKKKWAAMITVIMAVMMLALTVTPTLAQGETESPLDVTPRQALGIKAPRVTSPGEEVTIHVFQRGTEEAVKDAGVWALTRENAELLKEELIGLREQGVKPADIDFESIVSGYSIYFLGYTNGSGQVKYTFEEPGGYLLVALKDQYRPGMARLCVREIPDALGIEAPRVAPLGEQVTIHVFQRGTEEAVKDAGVWALTRDNAELLKEELVGLREQGVKPADIDFESIVSGLSIYFLGTTNGSGNVKYTFEEPGGYLLVAVKQNYIPGFSPIKIGTPRVNQT